MCKRIAQFVKMQNRVLYSVLCSLFLEQSPLCSSLSQYCSKCNSKTLVTNEGPLVRDSCSIYLSLQTLTKSGTHRPAINEGDAYECPQVKQQNSASGLCQMERDFSPLEERREVLCRETGDKPQAQVNCRLTSAAENCCAARVLIYLKNKRTSPGHPVNWKANIGSGN